jgi:hypothetical protein
MTDLTDTTLDDPPREQAGNVAVLHNRIYWRGSGKGWLWLSEAEARRLQAIFAAEPDQYAIDYAKELSEAIAELEGQA